MTKLAVVLAALPLAALAAPPPGPAPADPQARFERMERRMRLARSLGIAEALDLDDAQAAKVNATLARYDERRKPLLERVHQSMLLLRKAASGDAGSQGRVDGAVSAVFEARQEIHAVDRDMYAELARDLTPEKRARLAVFLAHFQGRFGMGPGPGGMGHGMRRGPMGMGPPGDVDPGGMGPGGGMGMMGPGAGMGPGPYCPEDCPCRP